MEYLREKGSDYGNYGAGRACLAELLLSKGYVVHGIKRRASLFNTDRIDHIYEDPHKRGRRLMLHYRDLTDSSSLVQIVQKVKPDEICNLAAQSHVKVSFEEPEFTANSDALGTLRLLEAVRIVGLEKLTRNLDALRDWGHARDYVEMQWRMLQRSEPRDYVIATGEQHSVREFIELSASFLGFEISWIGSEIDKKGVDQNGNVIVAVDPRYFRTTDVDRLLGDASKARSELGWQPKVKFRELVKEMTEEDLKIAEKDALIKKHGDSVFEDHET